MPCKCKGFCDNIPRPSDSIGYQNPLWKYCSVCVRPFLDEKFRCGCCNGVRRKSSRYNIEAPSKVRVLKN